MKKSNWQTQLRDECTLERQAQRNWDDFLLRRPVCADCGEPITTVRCLALDDGSCLCPHCVRERMRLTEDCA